MMSVTDFGQETMASLSERFLCHSVYVLTVLTVLIVLMLKNFRDDDMSLWPGSQPSTKLMKHLPSPRNDPTFTSGELVYFCYGGIPKKCGYFFCPGHRSICLHPLCSHSSNWFKLVPKQSQRQSCSNSLLFTLVTVFISFTQLECGWHKKKNCIIFGSRTSFVCLPKSLASTT